MVTDFWISTAGSTPEFPIIHLARCLNARVAFRNGQITEAQADGVEALVENLEEDFYNMGAEIDREAIRWCPDCFPGKQKRRNLSEAQAKLPLKSLDDVKKQRPPSLPSGEKTLDSTDDDAVGCISASVEGKPTKSAKSSNRSGSDTRNKQKRTKRKKEGHNMSQAKRKPVTGTVDKHTSGGKSRVLLPMNGEITGSFYLNGTVKLGTEVRVSIALPEFEAGEAPQGEDAPQGDE